MSYCLVILIHYKFALMENTEGGMSRVFIVFIGFILFPIQLAYSQERKSDTWPSHIMLTNDNGIHDEKLISLAQTLAKDYTTHIVAPEEDKSGTTHFVTINKKAEVEVKRYDFEGIQSAHSIDGFPADSVIFGLFGLLKDNPPDLIVSGINGGPNTGSDWIFSGTIGAARMSAFFGVPAIAVSGLNGNDKDMTKAISEYVVRLVGSDVVKNMQPGEYLTMSVPRVKADEIQGVKLVRSMNLFDSLVGNISGPVVYRDKGKQHKSVGISFSSDDESNPEGAKEEKSWLGSLFGGGALSTSTWSVEFQESDVQFQQENDVTAYEQGYIVIVLMQADENVHIDRSKPIKVTEYPAWNK